MLDNIFMQILDMSKIAGIVIIAVLLMRLLLKKSPKVISYALWSVVLFRLLCPFSIEAPISIVPEITPTSQNYSLADEPISVIGAGEAAYRAVGDAVNGGLGVQHIRTTEQDEQGMTQYVTADWWDVWILFGQYVWLAGIAAMGIYSVVSVVRLRKRLETTIPLRENIFIADDINSPFVMGIFRPRIYIPSSLSEKEQEYIILHEQHHIKRCDHIIKLAAFAALCLHWFNPLVWLAFVLSNKDMEMSCDEAVIKKLGGNIRADYSESLLRLATGRRIIAGAPLAFGEGDTKGRIKNLAGWKKPVLWSVIAAAVLCAVLAVCLLVNPQRASFDIRITVPAGSESGIYYSDEEFSPRRRRVEFTVGQEVGDAEIFVLPTEVKQENAYDEGVYATPGMPASMQIERGGWFKVGIRAENPTDEDKDIYVTVRPAEVRIAEIYDKRPAIRMNGKYYIDPYMPVNYLPYGFTLGGELSAKQAHTSGLAGCQYYISPNSDEFYTYQQCGTPTELNVVDTEQLQWAFKRWVKADEDTMENKRLTLNDVIMLSKLGEQLSWADFESYPHTRIDAGMVTHHYEIDDLFYLEISGFSPEEDSCSILLIINDKSGARVNVKEDNVKEFIDSYYNNPNPQISPLDAAISEAILHRYASDLPDGMICTESHIILASETASGTPLQGELNHMEQATAYVLAMNMKYQCAGRGVEEVSGVCKPAKLTFAIESGAYILTDYWEPRDGAPYADDIRAFFPAEAAEMALDDLAYAEQLTEQCYHKALAVAERLYDNAQSIPDGFAKSVPHTWSAAWVNYSEEGYAAMVERSENRDLPPRYGNVEKLTPVVRIDSKAEFDKFTKETDKYFSFENGYDEVISFEKLAENYTKKFFEENSLLLAYVTEPSCSNRHEIEDVIIDNGILEVRICRIEPQVGDCAMAGWFMAVEVDKKILENISGIDAYICAVVQPDSYEDTKELMRVYILSSDDILRRASVALFDDGTFQMSFSPFSSYMGHGRYSIENNRLTLKTDDGMFVYVFDMQDDTLIFDAAASSEQTWGADLTDGAVLR